MITFFLFDVHIVPIMAAIASTQTPINSPLHAMSMESDKYKGAVVEVRTATCISRNVATDIPTRIFNCLLHFPCRFLSRYHRPSSLRTSAISRIYRTWSPKSVQIVYLGSTVSVLDRRRRPVGYVDVATLKEKWEANEADPVSRYTFDSITYAGLTYEDR